MNHNDKNSHFNWNEWSEWFANKDLGNLEPIRWFVEQHALDNVDSDHENPVAVAKSTVNYYLDDPDASQALLDSYS